MKVRRTVSTNLDNGEQFTGILEIDYTGVDQKTILGWAASNRIIAFQRNLRKLTRDECRALVKDGVVHVPAASAGHKIESEGEKINRMVGLGIPRNVAELAVRNPEALASITAEVENDNNDNNDNDESESE